MAASLREPTASELPSLLEKHANLLASLGYYDSAADVQLAAERLSTSFLRELTAEKLVERAVRNAMPRTLGGTEIRWSAISDAFGIGSTYSIELCKKFGLDPDEQVRCPVCSACEQRAAEEESEDDGR